MNSCTATPVVDKKTAAAPAKTGPATTLKDLSDLQGTYHSAGPRHI